MYAIVKIENKDVEMKSTGTTSIRYKSLFGKDLLTSFAKFDSADTAESLTLLETITQLAYVMNCQAKNEIGKASKDSFYDWLDQFEADTFQNPDVLNAVIGVWRNDSKGISELKNVVSPQ